MGLAKVSPFLCINVFFNTAEFYWAIRFIWII